VKLVVSIVSSALVAGRAQDVTLALALTNDGPRAAVVCAKDAPVARAALPEDARRHAGDGPHGSLLIVGDDCATVTKALARGGGDALFGRAMAATPRPGSYAITFCYDEREAHGFVPAQPIHVVAPPVRIDVPGS
jgi:hypothetical protein